MQDQRNTRITQRNITNTTQYYKRLKQETEMSRL